MAHRAAGFTLLEVVVSLLVLTTTAVGAATLVDAATRARALTRERTTLALIMLREVESLRAGLRAPSGAEFFDVDTRSLGSAPAPAAVFVARWQTATSTLDAATSLVRLRASTIGVDARPPASLTPSGVPTVVWLVMTTRGGAP
jgi:Tfp pilus assembly protein PilV